MNKQSPEHFIQRLFAEVWAPLDSSKLDQYYQRDLIAHMGDQTACYDDVVNRMHYCQKHFSHLENDIEDIISAGDKISIRIKQTCFPKNASRDKEVYHFIAIYQLRDSKVNNIWAVFNPSFNYFEK